MKSKLVSIPNAAKIQGSPTLRETPFTLIIAGPIIDIGKAARHVVAMLAQYFPHIDARHIISNNIRVSDFLAEHGIFFLDRASSEDIAIDLILTKENVSYSEEYLGPLKKNPKKEGAIFLSINDFLLIASASAPKSTEKADAPNTVKESQHPRVSKFIWQIEQALKDKTTPETRSSP